MIKSDQLLGIFKFHLTIIVDIRVTSVGDERHEDFGPDFEKHVRR